MTTYKIQRYFFDKNKRTITVKRGLTLEEAQAHCRDPQTSSRTCTNAAGKRRTKTFGPWFEGYTEDR